MLTDLNIEAELSYAYLHAVATRGGFSCSYSDRHLDGAGVDALVNEDGRFLARDSRYASFTLHVQLKATRVSPVEQNGRFSFSLRIHQYNKLRETRVGVPRILVVLYLPADPSDWLRHSEDGLLARRCAYWVSLRGAAESQNAEAQTVYIPRNQVLSVEALTEIMTRCSREEEMIYDS
ncbi:MAG TPA: DUF4365 domain-containing protein [Gemmataceae bacterium]|nr:DUF4365 domain-containing protein [Gemmataceae bacterium]